MKLLIGISFTFIDRFSEFSHRKKSPFEQIYGNWLEAIKWFSSINFKTELVSKAKHSFSGQTVGLWSGKRNLIWLQKLQKWVMWPWKLTPKLSKTKDFWIIISLRTDEMGLKFCRSKKAEFQAANNPLMEGKKKGHLKW